MKKKQLLKEIEALDFKDAFVAIFFAEGYSECSEIESLCINGPSLQINVECETRKPLRLRLLSVIEASQKLGMTRQGLTGHIRRGNIPEAVMVGGSWVIPINATFKGQMNLFL